MRRIILLLTCFLMPLAINASDGSVTWPMPVPGTDSIARYWLPANRDVYGASKLVVTFDNTTPWSEDMKGAFLYACEILEDVIPTSYPTNITARLIPVNSSAPNMPTLTEVVSHYYNNTEWIQSGEQLVPITYPTLSTRIKAIKHCHETHDLCQHVYDSILTMGMFTSPDIELKVYLYNDMTDIYSFAVNNQCDTGRYDFVTVILRSLLKGFGFFIDVRDHISHNTQTIDISEVKHFNEFGTNLLFQLSPDCDDHEAYMNATAGEVTYFPYTYLYAPTIWNDELSLNYFTTDCYEDNSITRTLSIDYGKGTVYRNLSGGYPYGHFRNPLSWRSNMYYDGDFSYWTDEYLSTSSCHVPYNGTINFSATTQRLDNIAPVCSSPLRTTTLSERENKRPLRNGINNEVEQYLRQFHPHYCPDGHIDHAGYSVAIQKKDGTWDVVSYNAPNISNGNCIDMSTMNISSNLDQYSRTCDGKLKVRVTYLRYIEDLKKYDVKYFLMACPPQKVEMSKRLYVDYVDDVNRYVWDVDIALSNLEGVDRLIVSQLEEGEFFPISYEVTDFKKGYFTATVDKELYTTFTVTAINSSGTSVSNSYTVPPLYEGEGIPLSISVSDNSITVSSANNAFSGKQIVKGYEIRDLNLLAHNFMAASLEDHSMSSNKIDIHELSRGTYRLKVMDITGRIHSFKFRKE